MTHTFWTFINARTLLAALALMTNPMANAEQPALEHQPIAASGTSDTSGEKLQTTSLLRLRAPLGGQEIELQQIDYVHGGASLLRTRIREGRRFTVFDIDAVTARDWAKALGEWAELQLRENGSDGKC